MPISEPVIAVAAGCAAMQLVMSDHEGRYAESFDVESESVMLFLCIMWSKSYIQDLWGLLQMDVMKR